MRYMALATDYDGTLATNGAVGDDVIDALERLRGTGRRLFLVTGRQLEDLQSVFPRLELFDRVVAENGAVIYRPESREIQSLGSAPDAAFIEALRARGVDNIGVGRVIVSTWSPHETNVIQVIHELGLDLQVIFNKGAVMILPSGLNKAVGLVTAATELGLTTHNIAGVGDAENDHVFLKVCECGVAVANALPAVRERCDFVTRASHGAGVAELIEMLIDSDLAHLELARHHVLLGRRESGETVSMSPDGMNVLLAGSSGSGKSTLATGLLERLAEADYQYCIIDPEGDYEEAVDAVVLGSAARAPQMDEVMALLEKPGQSLVVNLLGITLDKRPAFFEGLAPRLAELRARTARPHWIVVDEAHHMMPPVRDASLVGQPQEMKNLLMVTVHPDHLAPAVVASIDMAITMGRKADEALRTFAEIKGEPPPKIPPRGAETETAIVWSRRHPGSPYWFRPEPPQAEHRRHLRKYAEGNLGEDRSFYFRGPEGKLRLQAQNLAMFLQMAAGVDDETWLHHLRRGDYSHWFRKYIKDPELADDTARIEGQPRIGAQESRQMIRDLVEQRYTAPS